jgi:preprotein translocase subunit SecY
MLLNPASNDGIILQKHHEVHIVDKIPPKSVHDILENRMKRLTPSLITIALSLVLALFTAALTYSAPSEARTILTSGDLFVQESPPPQSGDHSISGSTDQIVIMGGVISAIIILPILTNRRAWR